MVRLEGERGNAGRLPVAKQSHFNQALDVPPLQGPAERISSTFKSPADEGGRVDLFVG